MSTTEVIIAELPIIAQIIKDEMWLCSERRGCLVDQHDPEVSARVCEVILQYGLVIRRKIEG